MQRHPGSARQPVPKKRPLLPPKRAPRPVLKPQSRAMPKQHRGGRQDRSAGPERRQARRRGAHAAF